MNTTDENNSSQKWRQDPIESNIQSEEDRGKYMAIYTQMLGS